MIISDIQLNLLRESVREYMSNYRYNHTLGVEEAVIFLGEIFLPNRLSELRAAALLHDIAKECSYEEQLELLQSMPEHMTEENIHTKPALHSLAAIPLIFRKFSEFATEDVISAVSKHTLGSSSMSLFDKLIFIADYIELGRTHSACILTSDFIRNNISKDKSLFENEKILNEGILMSINFTLESLNKKNENIHSSIYEFKKLLEENSI